MLLLFLENRFGLLTINRNKIKQMIVSVRSVLCETFTCGNRDAYQNKTQIKGSKYNMSYMYLPLFSRFDPTSKQSRNSERLIELIFLTGFVSWNLKPATKIEFAWSVFGSEASPSWWLPQTIIFLCDWNVDKNWSWCQPQTIRLGDSSRRQKLYVALKKRKKDRSGQPMLRGLAQPPCSYSIRCFFCM